MLHFLPWLGTSQLWRTLMSWIVGSSGVRRQLHRQHRREVLWELVNHLQTVTGALGTETALTNSNFKTPVANLILIPVRMVAMECLLLRRHRMSPDVNEHGRDNNDTHMNAQTTDYLRDHRQLSILAMMEQENVQMVAIGLVQEISTPSHTTNQDCHHHQETDLVGRMSTLIFPAMGQIAEDGTTALQGTTDPPEMIEFLETTVFPEMTDFQETIDDHETEMTAPEMTDLEDAMSEMTVASSIEIESVTGTD